MDAEKNPTPKEYAIAITVLRYVINLYDDEKLEWDINQIIERLKRLI
jgi:hypothetical protein